MRTAARENLEPDHYRQLRGPEVNAPEYASFDRIAAATLPTIRHFSCTSELFPHSPHALVVVDDFLIRMDAIDIVEQVCLRVLEAEHAEAAYELLKSKHPHVVLLFTDVQMPGGLDGFALAHKVDLSWPVSHSSLHRGTFVQDRIFCPQAPVHRKPFNAGMVHAHLKEILPDILRPLALQQVASTGSTMNDWSGQKLKLVAKCLLMIRPREAAR